MDSPRFFQWLAQCCLLLGKDIGYGTKLIEDTSWFGCFDDGMTPEEAVKEFKEKNPNWQTLYEEAS